MYYQATKDAVKNIKAAGKKIHMLDIGTGTGLLAMMAVRSGADGATACEVPITFLVCMKQIVLFWILKSAYFVFARHLNLLLK